MMLTLRQRLGCPPDASLEEVEHRALAAAMEMSDTIGKLREQLARAHLDVAAEKETVAKLEGELAALLKPRPRCPKVDGMGAFHCGLVADHEGVCDAGFVTFHGVNPK